MQTFKRGNRWVTAQELKSTKEVGAKEEVKAESTKEVGAVKSKKEKKDKK